MGPFEPALSSFSKLFLYTPKNFVPGRVIVNSVTKRCSWVAAWGLGSKMGRQAGPVGLAMKSPQQPIIPRHQSRFTTTADGKIKEYEGRTLVGFSPEQMFDVVADVGRYKDFVPFCKKSLVTKRSEDNLYGELEIGFPPVVESYVSHVVMKRPYMVKADCTEGKLFNHLTTLWRFNPGLKDNAQTCVIHFYVSFEFRSLLHSQMAHFFFNELVRQMEGAFFEEARRRHGEPVIQTVRLNLRQDHD